MCSLTTGRLIPSLQTASPKDMSKMRIPQSTAMLNKRAMHTPSEKGLLEIDFSDLELRIAATLKPCKSPYCECDEGKCSHSGFYDARSQAAQELMEKPKTL